MDPVTKDIEEEKRGCTSKTYHQSPFSAKKLNHIITHARPHRQEVTKSRKGDGGINVCP